MCEKCQKDQKIAELSDALAREQYRADEWSRVSIAKAGLAKELSKKVDEQKSQIDELAAEVENLKGILDAAANWSVAALDTIEGLRDAAAAYANGRVVDEPMKVLIVNINNAGAFVKAKIYDATE